MHQQNPELIGSLTRLPTIEDRELAEAFEIINRIRKGIETVVLGKSEFVGLVIASLISGGHVLLEDYPGVGKTIFAKALATSIRARYERIQCTPDLMPADITGYIDPRNGAPKFGRIFTNILLVDELNRAQPRTQSGLLEAMAESQVTLDKSYALNNPFFFVIATQNPVEHRGVNDLPEAQLDRFQVLLTLDYPGSTDERQLLIDPPREVLLKNLEKDPDRPTVDDVERLIKLVDRVWVEHQNPDADVIKYTLDIVGNTRRDKEIELGASPRAARQLIQLAKGYALVNGQDYVEPDYIKELAMHVLPHRIVLAAASEVINETKAKRACIGRIVEETPPPGSC